MNYLKRQMFHHSKIGLVLVALVLTACGTSGQTTSTTPDSTTSVVASEWGMQGTGNETTDAMELAAGSATVSCTYSGTKDFAIDIVDAAGTTVQQLVSPAGTNCAGLSYDLKQTGTYTMRIIADGPWELNVTSGDSDGVTEVR